MLSYRHAFHAGNHADVLKHIVLVELLNYLNQKEKPYCYIDTHAGAGRYRLGEGFAAQNNESESGIARLWGKKGAPDEVKRYLDLVRSFQSSAPHSKILRFYPGSPLLAKRMMRGADSLRLFEKHPTDFSLLKKSIESEGESAKTKCDKSDGFLGLKATLPPLSRRGLILIDPSYEVKDDYRAVIEALTDALKRFATGVYMLWYPCLGRAEGTRMVTKFKKLSFARILHAELIIKKRSLDGFGMFGSGVLIGNPPWTLKKSLETIMPYLVSRLGEDESANYRLEELKGKGSDEERR